MPKHYGKSNDGIIHLVGVVNSEFTLCGNAFDGEADRELPNDPTMWVAHPAGPVTCPVCIRQIKACRGVKTKA